MYLFVKTTDTVRFRGSVNEGKYLLITTKKMEMAERTHVFI